MHIHPLANGTSITSHKGECDNDGEKDRSTGPGAVGTITGHQHCICSNGQPGYSYSVTFPNGVWVHIDEDEMALAADYRVGA